MEHVNVIPVQKELLARYIAKGSLPEFPLSDLESKQNQKVLKGFVDCFIEECSEAYNELELMLVAASANKPEEAKEHLRRYNEEVADANHFLLEVLIYSGYESEAVDTLIETYCKDKNLDSFYKPDKPFDVLMAVAGMINRSQKSGVLFCKGFRVADEMESLDDYTLRGGRRIDPSTLAEHAEKLWYVTHSFKQLCNTLKNRDWTSTHRALNEQLFEEFLLKALLYWALYLDFSGFGQIQICKSYLRKANINLERINNGY
jgi:hypothetical protein